MAEQQEAKRNGLRRGNAPSGGGPYVGWDDERDIPVLMDEQQDRPEHAVWRVVVHARGGNGWWTLLAERLMTRAQADWLAAWAIREGGCSNAGVYAEVGGQVELPGWIKVREGEAGT